MSTKCPRKPGEEVGISEAAVMGVDKLSGEDARTPAQILWESSVCT